MTGPTPIRASVTEQPDGSLVYLLCCPCLTVRGLAAPWEPACGLWARLDAEHRKRAPLCPHAAPISDEASGMSGVTLRWFAWIAGSDPAPIRRALAGLSDGLTFLAARGLAGRVTHDDPGTVWLSAHLAADEVAGVVAHELEHVRLLRLAGPPRTAAEAEAHELAARIAERGVDVIGGPPCSQGERQGAR